MTEHLFHFSEDPSISRFVPHVAPTSDVEEPLVWAIDAEHADLYYFPRECPRVTFFVTKGTTAQDRERFFGLSTTRRIAAIEATWLERLRETRLYRYLVPGSAFELRDANAGYWVSRQAVEPIRIEPVGDLLRALADADVEVRILPSLWPLYEAVIASTLGFSIIRWRNAAPRSPGSIRGPNEAT